MAPPPCGPGRNTPPWAESLRSVRQPLRKTPADPPCVSALIPPSFPSGCDHHFYYQHDQHDQSDQHDRRWRRTSRTDSPAAPPARSLSPTRRRAPRAAAVHRDRRRRARRERDRPQLRRARHRARSASAAPPIARPAAASARSAPARRRRAPRGEGGQGAAREGEEGGEARARGAGRRGGGDRRGRRRAPPRGGGGRGGGEGGGGGGGDARSQHRRSRPTVVARIDLDVFDVRHRRLRRAHESATRYGRPRARCRHVSRRRRHHPQAIERRLIRPLPPGASAARLAGVGRAAVGVVVGVKEFGVFVACGAERDGLIHVSEFPRGAAAGAGRRIDCYVQRVDLRQGRLSLTPTRRRRRRRRRRARSPPPAPPPALTRSFALGLTSPCRHHVDRRAAAPRPPPRAAGFRADAGADADPTPVWAARPHHDARRKYRVGGAGDGGGARRHARGARDAHLPPRRGARRAGAHARLDRPRVAHRTAAAPCTLAA